jgi:hypothetical protein
MADHGSAIFIVAYPKLEPLLALGCIYHVTGERPQESRRSESAK